MYKKIKRIENIILASFILDVCLILFMVVGLPQIVFMVLFLIANGISAYLIIKNVYDLRKEISKSKNILPASVIKTVELDHDNIIMYDDVDYKVVWENEFFIEKFGSFLDQDVREIMDGKLFNEEQEYLEYNEDYFEVISNDQTFILRDVTQYVTMLKQYQDEQDCILLLRIDNLEDLSSSVDEIAYQQMIQKTRSLINDYSASYDSVLRRYRNDSYIIVVKQKDFNDMIEDGEKLLGDVRNDGDDNENEALTISIGASLKFKSLKDAEIEAGKALDMALARGGNQIVVKEKEKDYVFCGGGSESQEKRSRVKVRLLANTLDSLIQEASNVVIMPHRNADMDAIGACYGMAKLVSLTKKDYFICADPTKIESNTRDAYETLGLSEIDLLESEDDILEFIDEDTLLIIVDTSNVDIVESIEIYNRVKKRVIIDHHRKAKEFIENPLLVYIESYASSAVELVCELLKFQTKNYRLNANVATLMLAGMMVDTSYFTVRTGVRTFEAATFLKEYNASPLEAKEILQISRDTYQKKLEIASSAIFIDEKIAVSTYRDEPVTRTLLAQAASELLELKDIVASFVIAYLEDGSVGISSRSNGDYNVQTIVEHFGGGGHFSMAAAQTNGDINKIQSELIDLIKEEEN